MDASPEPGYVGSGVTTVPITSDDDLMAARRIVRAAAVEAGFSLVDQTKIVTAASELARNCYVHGGGGKLTVEHVTDGGRRGLLLAVSDQGPGISDVETALAEGYSTGTGLGYGLGGARRLMDEFTIVSERGRGTTVRAVRWQ